MRTRAHMCLPQRRKLKYDTKEKRRKKGLQRESSLCSLTWWDLRTARSQDFGSCHLCVQVCHLCGGVSDFLLRKKAFFVVDLKFVILSVPLTSLWAGWKWLPEITAVFLWDLWPSLCPLTSLLFLPPAIRCSPLPADLLLKEFMHLASWGCIINAWTNRIRWNPASPRHCRKGTKTSSTGERWMRQIITAGSFL